MRIRSTKPEFYRSKTISQLSWGDRHVLKALESYVDDNGVGKDDVALFAADAFPRDMFRNAPETFRSLSKALDAFAELGLIVRYEGRGDNLLYVDRWSERQRIDKPSKGRFPRPDGTLEYADKVDRASFATVSGALPKVSEKEAPGTGEQGNRGTEEQTLSSDTSDQTDPDRFEEFWDAYGKKDDRKNAKLKWALALKKPGVTADLLIARATAYVTRERANEGGRYIMGPSKWLLGERWNDESAAGATGAVEQPTRRVVANQCRDPECNERHHWDDGPNHFYCMGVQ